MVARHADPLVQDVSDGGQVVTTEAVRTQPWLDAPFVVRGVVHGFERGVRVPSPEHAMEVIIAWLQRDDDARALWYLHEAHPGDVTVIGRPTPGTVGETRRAAHLFSLPPGVPQYGSLTARCGVELDLPEIQWLNPGHGMPCEHCLILHGSAGDRG